MPFILTPNDRLPFSLTCVYFHENTKRSTLSFCPISYIFGFPFLSFHTDSIFFNYCRLWSKANLDTFLFQPFSYYSLFSFSASHSLIASSHQNRNILQPLPKDQKK